MTTDNRTIFPDNTSDANFRAWGEAISQSFVAASLVRTADTGQINWATVVRAAPGNGATPEVSFGFDIFRFSDAMQGTKPVFIKVEYGVAYDNNTTFGTVTPGCPFVAVSVGTGTNGAGALTGLVSTRTRFIGNLGSQSFNNGNASGGTGAVAGNTIVPVHASGDGSYINMVVGASAQAQPFYNTAHTITNRASPFPCLLSIERTRNADGTTNGGGVHIVTHKWLLNQGSGSNVNAVSGPTYQMLSFENPTSPASPVDGYVPFAMPGQGYGTANIGGDIYYYPLPMATPKPYPQALGLLGTFKNDVPLLTPQIISVLGAPHTYLSLAGIAGAAANDNTRSRFWDGIPNGAMMMRYE